MEGCFALKLLARTILPIARDGVTARQSRVISSAGQAAWSNRPRRPLPVPFQRERQGQDPAPPQSETEHEKEWHLFHADTPLYAGTLIRPGVRILGRVFSGIERKCPAHAFYVGLPGCDERQ